MVQIIGRKGVNIPPPMAHQTTSCRKAFGQEAFAYFCEPGTGKSRMVIDDLMQHWQHFKLEACVIVAPKGVYHLWEDDELPKHCPLEYHVIKYESGRFEKCDNAIKEYLLRPSRLPLFVLMNIEAFRDEKPVAMLAKHFKKNRAAIVIDESSKIKGHKSNTTKNLIKAAKFMVMRRIATGTPTPNNPMDIFSQMAFLDKDIIGYPTYFHMQRMHCIMRTTFMGGRSFNQIVDYKNLKMLYDNMDPYCIRLTKAECLDLPDKVRIKHPFTLPPLAQAAYDTMKKDLILEFEATGQVSVGDTGLTSMLHLHQIANGFVSTEDKSRVFIHDEKIKAMMALIDTLPEGEPVVIWSHFVHCIQAAEAALVKVFGRDAVASYYGATSSEERRAISKDFIEGKIRFMVANPSTAGMGLTWVHCKYVMYLSNSFKLEDKIQSEDRCHRVGQVNKVTYWDIVASGTIDEKVSEALARKESLAKVLMTGEGIEKYI